MQVAENHQAAHVRPRLAAAVRRFGPAALLFAVTCLMWWRLVFTDQYTWMDTFDLALQVLPWWQFQAGEWHSGRIPLWDPNHWGGQPLIGQAQPGVAYPLNWLLFAVPLRHGWLRHWALCWFYVVTRFLAALFTYWLCRYAGRSRRAAVIGGFVLAFGGFMASNDWPQMFGGALWAPLVFLFLLRSFGSEHPYRNACWSGLFLGVSWLSGHHQIPTFLTLAAVSVWIWLIFRSGPFEWRRVRAFALFILFMVLVGGAQTLPAWEYGRHARRWVGAAEPLGWDQPVPYYIHSLYATTPVSVLGIVFPGLNPHTAPFIGMCGAALVFVGVAAAFGDRLVRLFTCLGVCSFLFALGPATLVHGVAYALIPLVEKSRSTSVALVMFSLSCSILCAYGIDHLQDLKYVRWAAGGVAILGAATIALYAVLELANKLPGDQRPMLAALMALVTAGVLAGWHKGQLTARTVAVALGGILLVEFSALNGAWLPNRLDPNRPSYLKKMRETTDIAEFLATQPRPLRVDVDDKEIPFNFGDWFGIEQNGGYLASLTENVIPVGMHTERSQRLFGVGYYIGKQPRFPGQVEVYSGKNGLKVFADSAALPRARVVRRFVKVNNPHEAPQFIQNLQNDLSKTASLMESLPQVGNCAGATDHVAIVRHVPNRVTIHATLECRGMVVLADTYFPGWHATVDGKPARLYQPYGVLRGVVVDEGDHVIEMTYRPASVVAGAAMTFAGLLAGAVLLATGRRR